MLMCNVKLVEIANSGNRIAREILWCQIIITKISEETEITKSCFIKMIARNRSEAVFVTGKGQISGKNKQKNYPDNHGNNYVRQVG